MVSSKTSCSSNRSMPSQIGVAGGTSDHEKKGSSSCQKL